MSAETTENHEPALPPETAFYLRKPIMLATMPYDKLVLRTPTAAEWSTLDDLSGTAADIQALSIVAVVPTRVIEEMGVRDLRSALKILGKYIADDDNQELPEDADETVIRLRKPITAGNITVSELHLREPKASDWQHWEKLTGTKADIAAIARVSGQDEIVIRQLDLRDLRAGARFLGSFFGSAPAIGAN